MSANPPPDSPDERRRKSNRLAFTILGSAFGCGCLWFVFAFGAGMAMGVYNGFRQHQEIQRAFASPTPDEDDLDLRLRQ